MIAVLQIVWVDRSFDHGHGYLVAWPVFNPIQAERFVLKEFEENMLEEIDRPEWEPDKAHGYGNDFIIDIQLGDHGDIDTTFVNLTAMKGKVIKFDQKDVLERSKLIPIGQGPTRGRETVLQSAEKPLTNKVLMGSAIDDGVYWKINWK